MIWSIAKNFRPLFPYCSMYVAADESSVWQICAFNCECSASLLVFFAIAQKIISEDKTFSPEANGAWKKRAYFLSPTFNS